MSHPWSLPPTPLFGDPTAFDVYAAKGMALSHWEELEESLSKVLTTLSSKPYYDATVRRIYGAPSNFKDRLDALERKAETVFRSLCDQALEGQFAILVEATRHSSVRPNEFAHSIVVSLNLHLMRYLLDKGVKPPREQGYFLAPPSYSAKKLHDCGCPIFMYTSKEIVPIADYFLELSRMADDLARTLERRLLRSS